MNEYPKILYKFGDLDGETVIVLDEEQEAESRKDGFRSLNEPEKKSSNKGSK